MRVTAMRQAALCGLVATAGCAPVPPSPVAQAYLFQKGPYQAVYDPWGRMLRMLYDGDGDGRADVVFLYERGHLRRVEHDEDRDGAVERWEDYGPRQELVRVGVARRRPGRPDLWEDLLPDGRVRRRQLDESGDGRIDRTETFGELGLERVELDTDADGRPDRWQRWNGGRMTAEDLDTDADGDPDRRLHFDARGRLERLQKLGPQGG